MKKILIALLIFIIVTSFTKPTEENYKIKCKSVGNNCEVCQETYTITWPRGVVINVWHITLNCEGGEPVVLAEGWYKTTE